MYSAAFAGFPHAVQLKRKNGEFIMYLKDSLERE